MNLQYFIQLQKIFKFCLIMLLFFYVKSSSYCLSDLKTVCLFTFEANQLVTPPKNVCTAIGTYQSIPIPSCIDFDQVKKDLPYVYIWNMDDYSTLYGRLHENIDNTFKEISQNITNKHIDILIFDIFFNEMLPNFEALDMVTLMSELIDNLKNAHKNILIGFSIDPHIPLDVTEDFYPQNSNISFDFYLIPKYYPVDKCEYHHKHDLMLSSFESPEELTSDINTLIQRGFNLETLFPSIQMFVISFKKKNENQERWTYSYLCSASDLGYRRRQCVTNLTNLYQLGLTIEKLNLTGVFIYSADCDDFDDACKCGTFPAIRSIVDGLHNSKENTSLTQCATFGKECSKNK